MTHPEAITSEATSEDVPAIAALRTAVAEHLTKQHGHGHWSSAVTERSVAAGMLHARVLVARRGAEIVGTLRLVVKKPWAIDPAYFTFVERPLHLTDMAVHPDVQRRGLGRLLVDAAVRTARAWPRDALRLDAYDGPVGAGPFYAKCGFEERGRVIYRGVPHVYFELVL